MHEEDTLMPRIDTLRLLKSNEIASFVEKIPKDIHQNIYYDYRKILSMKGIECYESNGC